jgi:hypothetical protein
LIGLKIEDKRVAEVMFPTFLLLCSCCGYEDAMGSNLIETGHGVMGMAISLRAECY